MKKRHLLALSMVLTMTISLAWSQDQSDDPVGIQPMEKVGMLNDLLSSEVVDEINVFAAEQGLKLRSKLTEVTNTSQGLTAITPIDNGENLSDEDIRAGADVAVLFFSPVNENQSQLKEGCYVVRLSEDPDGTPRIDLVDSNGKTALTGTGMMDSMDGKPEAGMETAGPAEAQARLDFHFRLHIHYHRYYFFPGRYYRAHWWWFWLHIHIRFAAPAEPVDFLDR